MACQIKIAFMRLSTVTEYDDMTTSFYFGLGEASSRMHDQ